MPTALQGGEDSLYSMQNDARSLGEDLGITTRDLTDTELIRFDRAFERQFVAGNLVAPLAEIHSRHIREAMLGAMIAKEQMDATIDGEQPASNKVGGPVPPMAPWFIVGDNWEDILGIYAGAQGSWSTGTAQDWIHSGSSLGGGAAGNAIRFGDNAVHVIYGIYSLHSSPKIEAVQFVIDGKTKPILELFWAQRCAPSENMKIKELDSAFIWKRDTTVKAQVFIGNAFGNLSTHQEDYPALLGVSFIKEPALRLLDPATIVGTRYEVCHTT